MSLRLVSLSIALILLLAGLFAILIVLPAKVAAGTLHVGGTGPGNYSTIQGAINAANPGDTVYVHAKTYREAVTVNKMLSLVGEDMNTTVIDGLELGAVVMVTSDWVNITGFTVTNASSTVAGSIELHQVQHSNVEENNVLMNPQKGIFLNRSGNNTIVNNVGGSILVWYSHYNNITGNNVSFQNGGISLYSSNWNTISGNTAWNSSGSIWLQSSDNNILMNNRLVGSRGPAAIYFFDSSNNTVVNNTLISSYNGIDITTSDYNLIGNNTLDGIQTWGISAYLSRSNNVTGNSVSSNLEGITLTVSDDNTVFNNTLHSFYRADIRLFGSAGDVIEKNTMIDYGIFIDFYMPERLKDWNTHAIGTSNTVHGKPVYYLKNTTGGSVPAGAAQVLLANCSGVTVSNENLSHVYVGLEASFTSMASMNQIVASDNYYGTLWIYTNDSALTNMNSSRDSYGVYLLGSDRNTLRNLTSLNNTYDGIHLDTSKWNSVKNASISGTLDGIYVTLSDNNTVENSTVTANARDGVRAVDSAGVRVLNNTFSGNLDGVLFQQCNNGTIAGNRATGNQFGVKVGASSKDNEIVSNNVSLSGSSGIILIQSGDRNSVANNSVFGNIEGISVAYSGHNRMANNTANGNTYGIALSYADYNTVEYSTASSGSGADILISSSVGATLKGNDLRGRGIYLVSSTEDPYEWNSHSIDTSNTVHGKPIYYWKNTTGGNIPPGAGQVILASSSQVRIEDQNLSQVFAGIELGFSSHNIVTNVTATRDSVGIVLWYADNNTIAGSNVSMSNDFGLYLENASYNIIESTTVTRSPWGIAIADSAWNTLTNNTLALNARGVYFSRSAGNSVFHNNFLNNVLQAFDGSGNSWDDGYPSGGNHWSDYTGVDLSSGPNQDQPGGDGIGDTPFAIPGGSKVDRYPLMYLVTTPPFRPSRPMNLTANRGNGQVVLSWKDSISNGGAAITNYRIYRGTSPGGEVFLIEVGNVTTHTDPGLTNGRTYYYRVTAKNAVGEGPVSNEASAMPATVPGQPTGLTATSGNQQVSLIWMAPSDDGGLPITGYRIYRGTASGGETPLSIIGNLTSHLDIGLTNGVTYFYQVAAINSLGEGPKSGEASAMPKAVPTAPQNLTAFPGNAQVTLDWTAPASDGGSPVTNYIIYRGTTPGGEAFLIELGNVLAYPDTGLTNGQTYYYQVSAKNLAGEGPRSSEVSVTPATVPGQPLLLVATSGVRQITLTWLPPTSDGGSPITNYSVFRGTAPGGEVYLTTLGPALTYVDTGLANGRPYYYEVSALNANGEGARSAEASAATHDVPSAPTNLQATAGEGQVTLTWSAPVSNGGSAITAYRIYRGMASGLETLLAERGNLLTFTDSGLTNGATYYYKVSAVNAVGEGPLSGESSAMPVTTPSKPLNLQAVAGNLKVTLTWNVPYSNGGTPIANYVVYRGTSPSGETLLVEIGNALTYLDPTVTNGQTYYYEVSAKNTVGEGPMSDEARVTLTSPSTLPSQPLNLRTSAGNGRVTLVWDAPSSDGGSPIVGYRVYQGTSSGNEAFLAQLGDIRTFVDSGLANGQTYYYCVTALNGVGQGPQSNEASAKPAGTPGQPTGLAATATSTSVGLSWFVPSTDGGSPLTDYLIFRGTYPNGEALLTTVGGTQLSYTDTAVTVGVTYFYVVSARNAVGEGPKSNEAHAVVGAPSGNLPPTCTVTAPNSGDTVSGLVSIAGTASDPDGTVARVEVKIDEGPWLVAVGTSSWMLNWNTSVPGNGEHSIHVRSYDGTDYSAEVTLTVTVSNAPPPGQDNTLCFAVLAVIIVIVLLALFLRRRGKGESSSEKPGKK